MNRAELILALKSLKDGLSLLEHDLNGLASEFVYAKSIKSKAENLSARWFQELDLALRMFAFPEEVISHYHKTFHSLLELSIPPKSRKSSYLKIVGEALKGFTKDLLIPAYKVSNAVSSTKPLEEIESQTSGNEMEYLRESLGCAQQGYLRASTILGWCAAIHRMQKTVEKLGFQELNKKFQEMLNTTGRYKKHGKNLSISTLSELQTTVFDADLLWVLEYWGLIDASQHERLSICLEMRNTSAHPGDVKMTEENIASFFSDLKMYVYDNPKLQFSK